MIQSHSQNRCFATFLLLIFGSRQRNLHKNQLVQASLTPDFRVNCLGSEHFYYNTKQTNGGIFMSPQKIIQLIIGITIGCAGIYCIISPGITVAALAWIVGLFMVLHALSRIGVWKERRALGFGENYELISAILSLVFGAALIASNFFQFMVSTFIIYILAAWIAMLGVFRLIISSNLRRLEADTSMFINNYNAQMIGGVVLILVAVLIFIKPAIVTTMIGIFIGACLLLFGVQQVMSAIRSK